MNIGTMIDTWLHGTLAGMDEFGNNYYCDTKKRQSDGRERRWVIYNGKPEGSSVPAEWNAWLHHTTIEPLTDQSTKQKAWQLEHLPNLTGTANAYRPKGHIGKGGLRAKNSSDYEPWSPV